MLSEKGNLGTFETRKMSQPQQLTIFEQLKLWLSTQVVNGKCQFVQMAYGLFLRLALLNLLFVATAKSDDQVDTPTADSPIVAKFTIGKFGRPVLVPVMLSERKILCLLDTGAACSGFDKSLRDELGPPRGSQVLQTAAGLTRVPTFDCPNVAIGDSPLEIETPVACVDLSPIRRLTNADVFGVVGMDILKNCRLLIDFDRGELQFLNRLPAVRDNLGKRFPLQFRADQTPLLSITVANTGTELFVIDTGADSTSLQAERFDELCEQSLIQLKSSFASSTVAGDVRGDRGRISSLALGPFAHEDIRISRIHESSLGLRYLSRFRMILDFPGKAVYLRKSASYDKAEPAATSGLMLKWVEGEILVESIRKGGAGEAAGLKPRDVLVRINDKSAAAYDPFALRQLLTSEAGLRIPMKVRRDGSDIDVELVLTED